MYIDGLTHSKVSNEDLVDQLEMQIGQAIKLTPFWRKLSDFKISKPTRTSSTGSEAKETLIVSPIPSDNNKPSRLM
jgi:hypothetical protein